MSTDFATENTPGRRGAILKLFGAILVMLGVLDSLLTLRGGVPAYEFLLLVFFGVGVFCAGALRAASERPDRAAQRPPAPAAE